jgi:hypothetical protein
MLEIQIGARDGWDEAKEEFVKIPPIAVLQLEHSLISISKWESKWHKPFLQSADHLTNEEIIDYIRCMTISPGNVKPEVYNKLSQQNITDIVDYIRNPMTATWFSEDNKKAKSKDVITSELIYYWMVALQIPFECQKWHINRLLTLIRVCNAKNEESMPNKNKMSRRELMSRNAALNAQRKAKLNTKG